MPRAVCPRGCIKAVELIWWTCDPATGEDRFSLCGGCHGKPLPEGVSPTEFREYQRQQNCPGIPRDEWIPYAEASPPPLADLCGSPEVNYAAGCHHCPGAYAREPAAREAQRALKWWDTGQLGHLYPDGVPEVVCEAVDVADAARASWIHERDRLRAPKPAKDS